MNHCKDEWEYIEDIRENDDFYFIAGSDGYEGTSYGNGYYMVNKTNGDIEYAEMGSGDVIRMIISADQISIPKEYQKK